jgi:Kdo2-lipid IVA lauroyltransferase/acyltransferase
MGPMIAWIVKVIAEAVCLLPLSWAMTLARHWGWMLAHILRVRRRYVLKALARSLSETDAKERARIYNEMCMHQAMNMMEIMRFAGGKHEELGSLMDIQGEEHVKQALESGNGALILIAHFGNYDLMGLYAAKLFPYPLTIITKTLKNAKLNELWWDMRRKAGVKEVPSHNSYRSCVRVLRKNEIVGFMLDQNRSADQGIFVDFFGRLASTTPGLAFMAAQTGAPVVPAFMRRTPEGRHILEVLPPIAPPPDRKEETLLSCTAAYTKIIENEVRRYPSQWLWLHKRWKSRPKGEPQTD